MDWDRLTRVLIFAAIFIGIIGYVLQRDTQSPTNQPQEKSDQKEGKSVKEPLVLSNKDDDVVKVVWRDETTSITEFVKKFDKPVVIINAPHFSMWDAVKKWDWDYLGENLKSQVDVYVNDHKTFGPYWNGDKPMARLPQIQRKNPHTDQRMSASKFFEMMKNPSDDSQYYYLTSNIINFDPINRDVIPVELIDLDPLSEKQNINFWFGQKGVVAALHYDDYGNINTQLKGSKKWTLFSPKEHRRLFFYPFLHPHQAQSQVNLEKITPAFANALNAKPITVILKEGETLYLPPLWLHQVEVLETSINVNSWTSYPQSKIMSQVTEIVPFKLKQDVKEKTHRLQYFVKRLLKEMDIPLSWIWNDLITPRFQPLINDNLFRDVDYYSDFIDEDYQISDVREINRKVKKAVKLLKQVPEDTRGIWLGNYIEVLSYYTTSGNTELVPAMLKNLFKI
eukprot:TRINITY_DN13623_c0_g1_i1.p1 TRINITY_DN13623_c0_g1~~TRINITY_DN13623_c0_g1_i1.p1  ORF type:complete len:458 (-),score=96.08 TRINITY_DN13623_c0_g1_i1:12-1364(-)